MADATRDLRTRMVSPRPHQRFIWARDFFKVSCFSKTATMFEAVLSMVKAFFGRSGEQEALGVSMDRLEGNEHEAARNLISNLREEASERLTARDVSSVSKECSHCHCVFSRRLFGM